MDYLKPIKELFVCVCVSGGGGGGGGKWGSDHALVSLHLVRLNIFEIGILTTML